MQISLRDRVLAAGGVYAAFLAVLFVLLLETTHQERAAAAEQRQSVAALVALTSARGGVPERAPELSARVRVAEAGRAVEDAARNTRVAVLGGLVGLIVLGLLLGVSLVPKTLRAIRSTTKLLDLERARVDTIGRWMPGGLMVVDGAGALVYANEQMGAMLGHPVVNGREQTAFHPDGSPFEPEQYPLARALLDGEATEREETEYRLPDGRRVVIEVSSGPVRDGEGAVVGAVAALSDVTQRTLQAERLRSLQAQLRSRERELDARTMPAPLVAETAGGGLGHFDLAGDLVLRRDE